MAGFSLRHFMPRVLRKRLWGDRERWGLAVNPEDPHWQEWQREKERCYLATQRNGVGNRINNAGYSVMSRIDVTDQTILEIGAGDIRHLEHWNGTPSKYILVDVSSAMMRLAQNRLETHKIPYDTLLLAHDQLLPIEDASIDIVVSFYSMEHLYPLEPYLDEIVRILKPGGILIGAIPTEGGLAWGAGRFFTSRRWFKRNTTIDPDKIICWEHPNFADDILQLLDSRLVRQSVSYWPFSQLQLLDSNLIIRYQYCKT